LGFNIPITLLSKKTKRNKVNSAFLAKKIPYLTPAGKLWQFLRIARFPNDNPRYQGIGPESRKIGKEIGNFLQYSQHLVLGRGKSCRLGCSREKRSHPYGKDSLSWVMQAEGKVTF
jgi:hypothetical protein